MIRLKLKEAMALYSSRHGVRVTYEWLAVRTGLSKATIESLASRTCYDTRLTTVDKLCTSLECSPTELLEHTADQPVAKDGRSG